MNQAALFLAHLNNLSSQGKPVPSNAATAENFTLLKSVIADFINDTGYSVLHIFTQHYTLELGQCENIEIQFGDESAVFLSNRAIDGCDNSLIKLNGEVAA